MMQWRQVSKMIPSQLMYVLMGVVLTVVTILLLIAWLGGGALARLGSEEAADSGTASDPVNRPASVYIGTQGNLAPTNNFTSGSNGSDGALILNGTGVITFTPTAFNPPLDVDGDYVYHFTDIYIGPNVTVIMKPPYLNAPVYWLASGTVQIEGVIDLSGEDSHANAATPAERQISIPGAGGFNGGIARSATSLAQNGLGPGGAICSTSPEGSAAHAQLGHGGGGGCPDPQAYGNNFLAPLVGGSGGSGSPNTGSTANVDSGGAGGGAILIASSVSIAVNGQIVADGGDRDTYGGAGSGGSVHLISPVIEGTGILKAIGGLRASTVRTSYGRIRLEAFYHHFTGTVNPSPNLGTPYVVFLPPNPPAMLQVVSVSGVSVPALPTGSFSTPDVTIDASGVITFVIEARYVPLGSTVQLHAFSEDGPDLIINSTPLTGTFALSTAVISATLPSGYSRMFVHSDWTP